MRVFIATSALALAGAVGLAACSNDAGDYQSGAEDFIEGDLSDDVEEQLGQREEWEGAECEEPANTDQGTTYTCTAIDSQDNEWTFEVEITGDNEFQITDAVPTDARGNQGSTPQRGSAPADPPTATTGA